MPFLSSVYPLSSTIPKPARILFRFTVRSELDTKKILSPTKKSLHIQPATESFPYHFHPWNSCGCFLAWIQASAVHQRREHVAKLCHCDPEPPSIKQCNHRHLFFWKAKCTPPNPEKCPEEMSQRTVFSKQKILDGLEIKSMTMWGGFQKTMRFCWHAKISSSTLLNWAADTTPFAWAFWFVRCSPHPLSPLQHMSKETIGGQRGTL